MKVPRETRYPMPWGQMAAQEWGNPESKKKVLALHGWMDNSNSFQKLAPLLPSEYHIVAIDLCGHGHSSHKPTGCAYTHLEFCIDIKRLTDFLDWEDFAIVAHSMGGMISLLFVGLFPEKVTHLVCIDMLSIMACSLKGLPELTAWSIQELLAFEKKQGKAPVYKDIEEVVDRRMTTTPSSLSRDSAKIIMTRATVDHQNGIVLRTDPRLKYCRTQNYSYEDQQEILKRYTGRLLIFRATGTAPKQVRDVPVDDFINLYRTHCQQFNLIEVAGSHTVHLDEPEMVVDDIKTFLSTYTGIRKGPESKL